MNLTEMQQTETAEIAMTNQHRTEAAMGYHLPEIPLIIQQNRKMPLRAAIRKMPVRKQRTNTPNIRKNTKGRAGNEEFPAFFAYIYSSHLFPEGYGWYRKQNAKGENGMTKLDLIAADRIDDYVGNPDFLIIDLRERKEYKRGHIAGAVNMPYEHLMDHVCLPRDKELILYCERGSASMAEGKQLAERGYRVKTVIGGMHAYRGKYLTR